MSELPHDEFVIIPRSRSSHLSVYTASKIHHSSLWLALRVEWPEIAFTARWPEAIGQIPETPTNAREFWVEDLEDVSACDVVLVYGEPGASLRGALVEAGMGIALGKRVLVVGECESFGTWQFHPLCTRVSDLAHARAKLGEWANTQAQLEMW